MTILQPVLQPVLRPLLADPLAPGFGDGLSAAAKALFASGEKGVMFDFTRASNLYTDSARTTLVSVSGDGIGNATDLSPNAKHASSIGSARPTWNSAGYATWDAFDDYLQTAAIDFSGTNKISIIACISRQSSAAAGILAETSTGAGAGAFYIAAPNGAGTTIEVGARGNVGLVRWRYTDSAPPSTGVYTADLDFSAASASEAGLRKNGATVGAAAGDTSENTGTFASYALNIGARNAASLFFNGRIYRLLVIGRALTTTERNAAERWAAQPVGIAIP